MRQTTDRLLPLVRCALLVAVASCGSEPVGPVGPGQLRVTLHSANSDDAAAVLELSGSGLRAAEVTGGDVFLKQVGNKTRVVIVLNDPGQIDFLLDVDDMSRLPTVTVIEVADHNNQLRGSIADYRATITPSTVIARTGRSE